MSGLRSVLDEYRAVDPIGLTTDELDTDIGEFFALQEIETSPLS